MVGNEHQIPRLEIQVYTAAGIGKHNGFYTKGCQNPNGQGNFLLWQTLVIMNTPLEHDYFLPTFFADHKGSAVPRDGRHGKVRDFTVGDADGIFQSFGIFSQAAA